jgi:DNA-binding transcriptional ArsR family regulator
MGAIEPQMGAKETYNLSSALFGKTRRSVLALLFTRPDESFYLREVVRRTGGGQGAVQRELDRLAQAGIVTKVTRGRQVYYQANRDCPINTELRGLMIKTAGLADILREALAPFAAQIELAFIYGSQASGTASGTSDVDLIMVGTADDLAIHRAISAAEK